MDLGEYYYHDDKFDEEYKIYQSIPKYILMIVARITELSKAEQNKIVLYLFNYIQ